MKISLLLSTLIVLAFTSCTKTMMPDPATPPKTISTTDTTLNNVHVPEDFDWSTTRKIQFNFNGKAAQGYRLILKVTDLEGNVVMQKLQSADQTFQTILKTPSINKELVVSFGATTEKFDCTTGSVTMNFN